MRKVMLACFVLIALASSCAGTPDAQEYETALSAFWQSPAAPAPLPKADADCLAERFIADAELAQLIEAGLDIENIAAFSPGANGFDAVFAKSLAACVSDLVAFGATMIAEDDIELRDCVEPQLSEDMVIDMFAASSQSSQTQLVDILVSCQ